MAKVNTTTCFECINYLVCARPEWLDVFDGSDNCDGWKPEDDTNGGDDER
jgi:hypothetical protein